MKKLILFLALTGCAHAPVVTPVPAAAVQAQKTATYGALHLKFAKADVANRDVLITGTFRGKPLEMAVYYVHGYRAARLDWGGLDVGEPCLDLNYLPIKQAVSADLAAMKANNAPAELVEALKLVMAAVLSYDEDCG